MTPRTVIVSLLAFGLGVSAHGYSEEDWRRASRRGLTVLDSTRVVGGACGLFALWHGQIVFLGQGRDEILAYNHADREIVRVGRLNDGWNLQYSAMASWRGELYLLSRKSKSVYRYDEAAHEPMRLVLSLQEMDFRGIPLLSTFALDDRYVYVLVEAGFRSHIARVSLTRREAEHFAYAPADSSSLSAYDGRLYHMGHRSIDGANPVLSVYSTDGPEGNVEAALAHYLEMPCPGPAKGVAVGNAGLLVQDAEGVVWTAKLVEPVKGESR